LIKIIVPDENRISLNYTLNENIAMSEEKIRVPVGNPYIVVQGTQEELEAVGELISNIDRKLPQIMIEAKIVEINRNKTKDLGVSWFVGDQEGQISFGEMSLGGTMERQDLVSIRIQALEKKNLGRLVGNPRILTLSGKTAVISVGEKVPYRDIVADSEGNKSFPIKWLDVGVKMGVTPEVTQDGFIILHVFPKVSTFVEREYVLEGLTFKDPQPSEKSADTTARLRAGETLVIGGLIKSSDMETVTKIPLLGEIPIIGELFTLRKKTHEETELIIFLTPSLVAY
jgi:type IV pilus assembly protein PilQ